MTNSEKIKAYLDAGHKVEVLVLETTICKIYKAMYSWYIIDDPTTWWTRPVYFSSYIPWKLDDKKYEIRIYQEPIRYPKVGSKVVVLDSFYKWPFNSYMPKEFVEVWKTYTVCDVLYSSCSISVNDWKDKAIVDYRHLAPYIE